MPCARKAQTSHMLFLCSLDPSESEMKCKLGNALTGRISKLDIHCIPLMPFDQTEAKEQSFFLGGQNEHQS
ncbi:hypothetical protein I7I50_10842 [Histoplasma capsulatum G186AR]|uniref:Uncharacterized protein n=1 Tax=Ajellomyces capsulatus TaxID=5037 RepID=A0A8H8D8U9_AJECA|nr:hypothetical protein I7I52_02081 [Histoplasma capsulatum]QSS69531.1 hypothetical protein I7I50_10842 [Histoplasma capsulatum G186AR]